MRPRFTTAASATNTGKPARSHLPIILTIAMVARLITLLAFAHLQTIRPLADWGCENINIALSMHQGQGYSSPFGFPTGPTAFMTPVYPAMIAAVISIVGVGPAAAIVLIVIQILFSVLNVWVVMLVARAHFGVRTANFTGLICATFLPMILGTIYIWDTALSALLLTIALGLASRRSRTLLHVSVAGAACGIATLLNPALMFVMLALMAYSSWHVKRFLPIGFASFLLVLAPWAIRNQVAMHTFIPLRSNAGYEFWVGNPGIDGDSPPHTPVMSQLPEMKRIQAIGEVAYMNEKGAIARAYITQHPREFASLTMRRVGRFWAGTSKSGAPYTLWLTLISFCGLGLLWHRKNPLVTLYLLPLVIYPLPYYVTHADVRYAFVINPIQIILLAYACEAFLSALAPTTTMKAVQEVAS